jgi:hypothetical protein
VLLTIMLFLRLAFLAGVVVAKTVSTTFVNQTACNGKTYTYQELAGAGILSGNLTDEFGDTIGGIGSAIVLDRSQWKKLNNGSYTGLLWALPDRGWYVMALEREYC